MSLHIGIAGPITVAHVATLLEHSIDLPKGYVGAPLMGTLIRELVARGCRVSAFTTDAGLYQNDKTLKFSGKNFDLYVCPSRPKAWRFNGSRLGRAVDAFQYEIKHLKNAMELAAPDLLHAHWTYEFSLAALETKIPHLITCHDSPGVVLKFNRNLYRAIRYCMARAVFRVAKQLSTVSDYMADELKKYSDLPIEVIPNPLADYVLTETKSTPKKLPTSKKIVMVCNGWDQRKNPETALHAFNQFLMHDEYAELHLYGAGFAVGEIANQWAKARGLDKNLHFHGAVPHAKLITEMRGYDMLLHTALEESFGVVIAEAMALGLPVLAGENSGAIPWVMGRVENKSLCGILVDVSDVKQIVKAMVKMFDEGYEERSKAGIERATNTFTPALVVDQYIRRYQRILEMPRYA